MSAARKSALALALATAFDASAVTLDAEGVGQALIYPYYTVRSTEGTNAFNTYISVVNHTGDAKALRVRVREGRNAREVASFNLYLSPNDAWTGAMAPTTDGTRLISADASCTDPSFGLTGTGLEFSNVAYSGANADGFGESLDRTREGYVEILEMATLTGASAAAVTHNTTFVPANCAAIRAGTPLVAPPTQGLSGTLTLINVNNGMDFALNAEALADLSKRPFFRPASDPYPDFAAAEIDSVSVVVANGNLYRSTWKRPQDAVSAVLMRSDWLGEYVLDTGTASQTDFVAALPTRHHYVTPSQATPPFSQPALWSGSCSSAAGAAFGEKVTVLFFDREERGAVFTATDFPEPPPNSPTTRLCAAVGVASVMSGETTQGPSLPTLVFGSQTQAMGFNGRFPVAAGFQNGWMRIVPSSTMPLTSEASSTRIDIATGAVASGAHVYSGIPVVGFMVRTFRNGTLACGTGTCQGNYGGAFPFKYRRSVSPP
jgi:hypothetical protein